MKKVQVAGVLIVLALVTVSVYMTPVSANPGTRWDSLYAHITENYDTTEGAYTPADADAPQLYPTWGAATVLDDRGFFDARPPSVDLVKLLNFTRKLQWKSGGEDFERYGGWSLFIAGPVSIRNSYHGIQLWNMIAEQQDVPNLPATEEEFNATAALIYANKTQTESGGFGNAEGSSPDIMSTYYALFVMDAMTEKLGTSIDDWLWNRTKTLDWILSCMDGDAFKLSPSSSISGVTPTAGALLALDILGELEAVANQGAIGNWIIERQVLNEEYQEFSGGFEEGYMTNDTNLVSTYWALETLQLLGRVGESEINQVADFIFNCQTDDGTWGNVPGMSSGSLYRTGLAFKALNIIDDDGTIMNRIYLEDPNNPSPPLIDWRILFVVVFFIGALIVGLLALRLDY